MKKIVATLILSFFTLCDVYAIDIDKISEFSFTEKREQNNNMAVKDDKLYAVGIRGLEIFEIGNDSLTLLTEYNLEGECTHISIKNEYAYISTYASTSRLYRIYVSDIYELSITDTLHYLGNYAYFIDGDHVFVNELLETGSWLMHVYDNDTFQETTTFNVPHEYCAMRHVSDGLGIVKNTNDQTFYLYDVSNPDSILLCASGYIGDSSSPYKTAIVQDSVFIIASGLTRVKFYDISDSFNWDIMSELDHELSDFSIRDNTIILRGADDIWLYDISDPHDPLLLDHTTDNDTGYYNFFKGITANNNNIFVAKCYNGDINCYNIENNSLNKYFTYYSSGFLRSSYFYNENLYIQTWQDGIQRWDMTNLNDPVFIQKYYDEYVAPYHLSCDENIMVQVSVDKDTYEGYNTPLLIQPDGDPVILDALESPYGDPLAYKAGVGFFEVYNSTLFKYELDGNNELVQVATLDIPISYGTVYFLKNHPEVAYIFGFDSFVVINNIDTNDSMQVMEQYFTYYYYQNEVAEYLDYLLLSPSYPYGGCVVYEISDPLNPIESFTFDNSGRLAVDEDNQVLFIGNYICTVYDLSEIASGYIDNLCCFRNWSYAEQIVPFERDNTNYLLYLEKTSVSIYEYSIYDIDKPPVGQDNIISCFPNPFSNSTTISFSGKLNSRELSQINIYNIKGQLIKTITSFPNRGLGTREAVWDGRDEKGNEVCAGVYFYKLDTKDETFINKLLLLK
ncbi:MAG: T9SS type A sorting domain-containing protein [Candidatus Cloacimonetes bacterium]|nr:T9SS type A sorting domain-containing protein [Candidatus Cloacimonadota bacterium]